MHPLPTHRPKKVNKLASLPPASLQKMPWLAMIFLFWSYLKSDFDCVKIKVDLFNLYNQSNNLASPQLVPPKNAMASYDISIMVIS